jgi:hypothetical protein
MKLGMDNISLQVTPHMFFNTNIAIVRPIERAATSVRLVSCPEMLIAQNQVKGQAIPVTDREGP